MATEQQRKAVEHVLEDGCPGMFDEIGTDAMLEELADAILDAHEAASWVKAEDIPISWEGRPALMWAPGKFAEVAFIPRGFSRDPAHCGGQMFWLWPDPPREMTETIRSEKDQP